MYPEHRSLVKRMEGKPFVMLGISSDDDRSELRKVRKRVRSPGERGSMAPTMRDQSPAVEYPSLADDLHPR